MYEIPPSIPEDVRQRIEHADSELSQAEEALGDAVGMLAERTDDTLSTAESHIQPVVTRLIGTTSAELDSGEQLFGKATNSLVRRTDASLGNAMLAWGENGWSYPYTHDVLQQELYGDHQSAVIQRVPALAGCFGPGSDCTYPMAGVGDETAGPGTSIPDTNYPLPIDTVPPAIPRYGPSPPVASPTTPQRQQPIRKLPPSPAPQPGDPGYPYPPPPGGPYPCIQIPGMPPPPGCPPLTPIPSPPTSPPWPPPDPTPPYPPYPMPEPCPEPEPCPPYDTEPCPPAEPCPPSEPCPPCPDLPICPPGYHCVPIDTPRPPPPPVCPDPSIPALIRFLRPIPCDPCGPGGAPILPQPVPSLPPTSGDTEHPLSIGAASFGGANPGTIIGVDPGGYGGGRPPSVTYGGSPGGGVPGHMVQCPIGEPAVPFHTDWCQPTICEAINAPHVPTPLPSISSMLTGLPWPLDGIGTWTQRQWDAWWQTLPSRPEGSHQRIIPARIIEGAAAWLTRLSGADVSYHATAYKYTAQYFDPQLIPERGELIDLHNRGFIDRDTYLCLTRANGHCPLYSEYLVDAQQTIPSVGESVTLWERGRLDDAGLSDLMHRSGIRNARYQHLIKDARSHVPDLRSVIHAKFRGMLNDEDFSNKALASGWHDPFDVGMMERLETFVPPYSDLTRMMVHDVEDERVVDDYQLDAQFEDKYKGQLQQWARDQGIPDDVFLYIWRTHWSYPSNTQAYEFIRRLRRDRPERVAWEKANPQGPDESLAAYLNRGPIAVTEEMVRRLLTVNDLNQRWLPAVLSVSYQPITRTDATRAYEIGSFTEEQLRWNFIFNGYTDADAQLLVDYYKQQKQRRMANATGALTIRKVLQLFRDGALTDVEADNVLKPLMPNEADRARLMNDTLFEYDKETKRTLIKGIRRAFIFGEHSRDIASLMLADIGVPNLTAVRLLDRWQADMLGRLKEPTVRMLCSWYNHGIITIGDYHARLLRLGYDAQDAARIVAVCDADWKEKVRKEARKEADKAMKESNKTLANKCAIRAAKDSQLASNLGKYDRLMQDIRAEMERRRGNMPPVENGNGEG